MSDDWQPEVDERSRVLSGGGPVPSSFLGRAPPLPATRSRR